MKKLKIGIDVDGVIFDYMNTVRAYAEMYDFEVLNKTGVIKREPLKIGKRYNWTKTEWKIFADKYFVELSRTTSFNPLAVKILKKLKEEGHKLYIISNRGLIHEEAISVIEDRFVENNICFEKLFWQISDKKQIMIDNDIDIIIDDSPDICEDVVKIGKVALYFREKNSKKLQETEFLYDVDNWGEIYRHIQNLCK